MPTESDNFYKKGDIVDAPFPYQIPQDNSEDEKYTLNLN